MSASGSRTMQGWIDSLQAMTRAGAAMAEELAPIVERELAASVRAQQSPDGKAWAPSKSGEPVLKNAMSAVTVTPRPTSIIVRLSGHHALHHYGHRGTPARPIIPTGATPERLGNAIRLGLVEMGEKFLTRKGRGKRGR